LKTAVRQLTMGGAAKVEDVAAAFQAAVIDILTDRTAVAMEMFRRDFPQATAASLVVAGGVAANRAIGSALTALAADRGFTVKIPAPALCTDNAAMIAWAGLERRATGAFDPLSVSPRARWPLEAEGSAGG
jgi:N6-L-threonylcarbamoyladenine synthase